MQGSQVATAGNLAIAANHHLLLDAAIDYEYGYDKTTHKHGKWYKRKYTTTTTINEWTDADAVSLTANNIRLQTHANKANSHINIYAADMTATGGDIRLISTGNINLYALTNQHSNKEHSHTKKKLLGIRYNTTDNHNQRQQIAAVPATLVANYINSRSEGDTTLEGTRFEYLSGASFYAGDKINLLAAISTLQEQAQTDSNSVVWQSIQNTGKIEQSAQLPSFTGTAAPMFEAQGGLNIQIPISEKDVQKRQLKDEIITLASQPQYSYLNDLVNRNDVDWQQIILTDKDWDYKQQGLTPAGAAIVAIAVAYATGGVGTALTSTVATATGSTTLGTMTSAAFSSLVTQASISLIDNQGNIKQTLKDLGSKQNIKQMTFAIASAGIGSKINQTLSKSLSVGDIANSHNFSHKISKGIANATSTALLESTIYGTSLEKSLIKNLRGEVANAVASEIFTDYVKPLDKDTLIDNITHKLAAGLTGCLSAKAAGNRCEAGSIGAVVGEMWGDYQVDDPNTLTQAQKDKLINQAKLIAGITAAFAGEDVNVAAGVAAEAVRWNSSYPNYGSMSKNQQAECRQLGISTSDCGKYHGKKNLETLRQIGLFIIPTTPEEIAIAVVTGGAGRYVIKVGGKILSKTFESKEAAKKVLDKARRVENNVYRDDSYGYTWSQGKPRDFNQNLTIHWNKHKSEFPELRFQNDYYRFARDFVENPPTGTLTKTRSNGDVLFYQPSTNTFAIKDKNGNIKTMFKPKDKERYWNAQ